LSTGGVLLLFTIREYLRLGRSAWRFTQSKALRILVSQ
jgi:hypothetical protein